MLFSFRQVKPFLKGHNSHVMDPTIKKAVRQAEEALLLSLEQRKELVNCLASDEEEDDEEEDCDQTMPSEDECMSKEKSGQKRKNSDDSHRKAESDDDDDEVTGKKVLKRFKGLPFLDKTLNDAKLLFSCEKCFISKNKHVGRGERGYDHLPLHTFFSWLLALPFSIEEEDYHIML